MAGREWDGANFGEWVRPVGNREKGELHVERFYENRSDPQLLDIIEITLVEPRPVAYQAENHLVDSATKWKQSGYVTPNQLFAAVQHVEGPLWINGESTENGINDKVSGAVADALTTSLILIQPPSLTMVINIEGANFGNPRRRVRGHFSMSGHDYIFAVTDPIASLPMIPEANGFSTELQRPILCISLSEKFVKQNACYKLIAGVIRTE